MNRQELYSITLITFVSITSIFVSYQFFAINQNLKSTSNNETSNFSYTIVTTSFPVYSITKELVKETGIQVKLLLKPGMNAHFYEPKFSDIRIADKSRIVITTNKYFEIWAEKLAQALDRNKAKSFDASAYVEMLCEKNDEITYDVSEQKNECNLDPHVWLSPKNGLLIAKGIRDLLKTEFPSYSEKIEMNYQRILAELKKIDSNYENILANCENKNVFVYHKALGYLEAHYNIKQVPILNNFVPEGEPSTGHVELIIKQLKRINASHILMEPYLNQKSIEYLKDHGITPLSFDTMEVYYKEDVDNNITYTQKLEYNLVQLTKALKCVKNE
ncbi:MAG: zinc ABC transporter substrate-binding protein [Candidatus Micrarchaeota archaeon]|nr:zinc ABC transporter substrate-binding protein [Candidatus Micrarchaeota archaeon]